MFAVDTLIYISNKKVGNYKSLIFLGKLEMCDSKPRLNPSEFTSVVLRYYTLRLYNVVYTYILYVASSVRGARLNARYVKTTVGTSFEYGTYIDNRKF